MARYGVNGGIMNEKEELLRIDRRVKENLKLVLSSGEDVQPWVCKPEPTSNFVDLEFFIKSEFDTEEVFLAYEEAKNISLNGNNVPLNICGYYVDEDIHKISIGTLKKGTNLLRVTVPVSDRTGIENMFLLGNFDVFVSGEDIVLREPVRNLKFGSLTDRGLAFYGGNISYEYTVEIPKCSSFDVHALAFMNCVIGVSLDGGDERTIALSPHRVNFDNVLPGRHTIRFNVYGNRHNTLSALHITKDIKWKGPNMWYTEGDDWSYNYNLKDIGLKIAPKIYFY